VHPHPVTGNLPQKHASRIEGMRDHYAGLRIALIHKPPAKWVDSICRQSFDLVDHYDLGYEPGHTVIEIPYDDEHDPLPDRVIIPVSLEKLCDQYVRFHRFWMSEQGNWPFIAVAHAMAAFEPEKCVCQVTEAFALPRRSFEPVRGIVPHSGPFNADLYRDPDAYEHIGPRHLDVIRSRVTPDVLDFLGYS